MITYSVVVLTIFSSIDLSFSAVFFDLTDEFTAGDYFRSRPASVHRGLALSYSPTKKHQLCRDIFYAQLYVVPELRSAEPEVSDTPWVNDGQTTEGEEPQHATFVEKLETVGQDQSSPASREIFFPCVGNFDDRKPYITSTYFVYNAYRSGWWYGNILNDGHLYMDQRFLISLSPEFVQLEQEQLELQYLNTRQTLETLQNESPDYFQFVEGRDVLLSLSVFRKLFLCASILSSPTYREERLEFSLTWMRANSNAMSLGYETLKLTFTKVQSEKLTFQGFICEGFVDGDVEDSESTSLYIIQAYDDKHSVYVVKKKEGHFFLSKYFRNVPLLMNVNEPLDEGSLSKNYGMVEPENLE